MDVQITWVFTVTALGYHYKTHGFKINKICLVANYLAFSSWNGSFNVENTNSKLYACMSE